ncbi:Bug family tripartite tricarboxylate transporter substrate binding protein [Pseudorhodoferax sp.]|uniref:Bug family tripartite tricarboxylate transporter substrate binding protein n=1 Tax=Pseudorhodoferax sp. TaxID=1993553 RepID=UPI0039E549CE
MHSRRRFIHAAALAAIGGGLPPAALAQPYPSRPVRLIVPASAGTQIDVAARFMAEAVSRRMHASIVVENRAGAGGMLGAELVAQAEPDGYTLLVAGIPLYLSRWLSDAKAGYDPVKDFEPVAMLCSSPLGIAVAADSPYRTLADLVGAMRQAPDRITYSSGGDGSAAHICAVMLNDMTKTAAKHIPYKGNTPAVTDLAGGRVDFTCQGAGGILPLVKAGKLRALAVTNDQRWDVIPDVPTVVEAGVPGFDLTGWIGVMARAGTPASVVQKLSDAFVQAAGTPEFKSFCDQQQMFVQVQDHRQFAASVPGYAAQLKHLALLARKG